jgi:hypothetical protein
MPIVDDEQLKVLLAEGQISAISIDTSIFDQKRLQLNSATMQAFAGLKKRPFSFLLSGTVAKEVLVHLEKAAADALQSAKKAIGQALFSFETKTPERDALLAQISGGRSAKEASAERWAKYIKDTGCEVLVDTDLVNIATVYDGYFAGEPPFGSGRKKDEFPDALALNALEQTAAGRGAGILIVSQDGDWKAYCEKSTRLYIVPEIERALALVTNAPLGLRKAIFDWIANDADDVENFKAEISHNAERIDFSVNAHPTHGEVEISTWDGEFQSLVWPDEEEIDIIELLEPTENGALRVVASLPLILTVKVPIELDFSIYDSVDRESLGMGGRMIEVEEDIYVRTAVTLDVHGLGSDDEEIEFVESELGKVFHEVELGEVDMFEPEDYWDGEEEP